MIFSNMQMNIYVNTVTLKILICLIVLMGSVLGIYENFLAIRTKENLAIIVKDGYPFQGVSGG
jgi:hypothetical protein